MLPRGHDVGGRGRVAAGQVEVAGEVVARAGGDDPERRAGPRRGLEREVDRAVAAAATRASTPSRTAA